MNPHHEKLLSYFEYNHLPEHLQEVSAPFKELATMLVERDEADPAETSAALRKLLEAKDCAVRAAL
jgi:NAD(P)H-dependent FMN reductase